MSWSDLMFEAKRYLDRYFRKGRHSMAFLRTLSRWSPIWVI